ncbi:MlrC C-terminal domain-containing protein [Cupriavidus basilensis]
MAVGPLWDPVAVRIAFSAGVGARLPLRIGGKVSPMSRRAHRSGVHREGAGPGHGHDRAVRGPRPRWKRRAGEAESIEIVLITLRARRWMHPMCSRSLAAGWRTRR